MAENKTSKQWTFADELDFLKTLGPRKIDRYARTTRKLRVRDFDGQPCSAFWWHCFSAVVAQAKGEV